MESCAKRWNQPGPTREDSRRKHIGSASPAVAGMLYHPSWQGLF
ncbi:hypothetical protein GJA_4215 [Janthinobacterium agaricidamnosum NBRC 102515 = DSM 9628]|uniref:Uncharacterized protein n=1 Tax=Janthinobacterium agaricidamnosum NBRC 102515 = DSM 9628 TaxID=1349767 RepID=W0VB17_9BURK|nr:hypothetical protein GJA_4215 [Janthinobacterium agaricidamnosum NBRC 102515 = DSM 9628]